jgi:hypothetical protein
MVVAGQSLRHEVAECSAPKWESVSTARTIQRLSGKLRPMSAVHPFPPLHAREKVLKPA